MKEFRNMPAVPGFTFAPPSAQRRLIVIVRGLEGTGKSRFAMTMPGPVGVLATDPRRSRAAAVPFQEEGKDIGFADIYVPPTDALRDSTVGAATEKLDMPKNRLSEFIKTWNTIEAAHSQLCKSSLRSGVWDTSTELWELLRLAYFGRLEKIIPTNYVDVNGHMDSMLGLVERNPNLNFCFVSRLKEEWKTTKSVGEGGKVLTANNPTGAWIRDGYKGLGDFCDVELEMSRELVPATVNGQRTVKPRFRAQFIQSKLNAQLLGQFIEDDMICWSTVAALAVPGTTPLDWE
jgi:hypothetical protein